MSGSNSVELQQVHPTCQPCLPGLGGGVRHGLGDGEVEEDVVARDAVGGVRRPRVRDQQAGDAALRAPHAAAPAQVQHLEGGHL